VRGPRAELGASLDKIKERNKTNKRRKKKRAPKAAKKATTKPRSRNWQGAEDVTSGAPMPAPGAQALSNGTGAACISSSSSSVRTMNSLSK
jgi:hypothetical protein